MPVCKSSLPIPRLVPSLLCILNILPVATECIYMLAVVRVFTNYVCGDCVSCLATVCLAQGRAVEHLVCVFECDVVIACC